MTHRRLIDRDHREGLGEEPWLRRPTPPPWLTGSCYQTPVTSLPADGHGLILTSK